MTADGYALLVVDMQNGFCHPDGSFPRVGRGLEGAMDAVANAAVAVGQALEAAQGFAGALKSIRRDDAVFERRVAESHHVLGAL